MKTDLIQRLRNCAEISDSIVLSATLNEAADAIAAALPTPGRGMVPMTRKSSYHDVTVSIGEKKLHLADASYGLMLTCTRAGGWELWNNWSSKEELLAGEFHRVPLTIQVGEHVILEPRPAGATALGDGEGDKP